MKLEAQIETLRAAQGDALRLATLDVELAHGDAPPERQAALRDALVVASIPHWFNTCVFAELAGAGSPTLALRGELEALRCVERFVGRGPDAWNVQQSTRRAVRAALARSDPARLQHLSARAAAHFAADTSPAARVEHLYHLIVADAERGAAACTPLLDNWAIEEQPEERRALALALDELLAAGLQGRARGAALLLVIDERLGRGEAGIDMVSAAVEARALLVGGPDPLDLPRAIDLQGQVALKQGESVQALRFFEDALARLQALADASPHDPRRLHLLAVARSRMGDVLEFSAPESALEHFTAGVGALERLAAAEPKSTTLQREWAVALARRADVLAEMPGRLGEAFTAQGKALELLRTLCDANPANVVWRRDLAMQLQRAGKLLALNGELLPALEAHEAGVQIARALVALDPSQPRSQDDLASLLLSVADDLSGLDRPDAAELAMQEALTLYRHLVALQPTMGTLHVGLCTALYQLGRLALRQQRQDAALRHFEDYAAAAAAAAQWLPNDGTLQRERAVALNCSGQAHAQLGDAAAAAKHYEDAVRVMEAALSLDPSRPDWRKDLDAMRSWMRADPAGPA